MPLEGSLRVLSAIPDEEAGVFLAALRVMASPGEARALLGAGLSCEDLHAAFRHKHARTATIYGLEDTQRRERATAKLQAVVGTRLGGNWETNQNAASS